MRYTKNQPTAPGFYWVRRIGEFGNRIAEVVPCDAMDKNRPKGSFKLSFTQWEETTHLDAYEFAGPISPPHPADETSARLLTTP